MKEPVFVVGTLSGFWLGIDAAQLVERNARIVIYKYSPEEIVGWLLRDWCLSFGINELNTPTIGVSQLYCCSACHLD